MAKHRLDLHPKALLEITEAYEWYESQSASAADRFMTALRETSRKILAAPELPAEYMCSHRAARLKSFPYLIVYRIVGSVIRVSAIAHTSRQPGYWDDRLRDVEGTSD